MPSQEIPPRLVIRFAADAPLAVIIRRGPSEWSQLVLWRLKTNEFVRGQWVHGVVKSASLSPNGEHLAAQIQTIDGEQGYMTYSLVSKVPYFSALAIQFGVALYTTIAFSKESELFWSRQEPIEQKAPNRCPYPIIRQEIEADNLPAGAGFPQIDWAEYQEPRELETPNGRKILVRDGSIFEKIDDEEVLLYDSSNDHFEEMKAPKWAKQW